MPLEKNFRPRKMLLKKVESSIDILLKVIPRWLINENQLKEQ